MDQVWDTVISAEPQACPPVHRHRPTFASVPLIWGGSELDGLGEVLMAIAVQFEDGTMTVAGSGTMIAPGIVLTATHVLRDIKKSGGSLVLISCLPPNRIRVWQPLATDHTLKRLPDPSNPFLHDDVPSDVALIACELRSEAYPEEPLRLGVLELSPGLPTEMLWASGFRMNTNELSSDRQVDDNWLRTVAVKDPPIVRLVSAGRVLEVFEHGHGRSLPGSVLEIDAVYEGGMSGGPVVNERGHIVGIVSKNLTDGGQAAKPSYVSMIDPVVFGELAPASWPDQYWASSHFATRDAITAGQITMLGRVRQNASGVELCLPTLDEYLSVAPTNAVDLEHVNFALVQLESLTPGNFRLERISVIGVMFTELRLRNNTRESAVLESVQVSAGSDGAWHHLNELVPPLFEGSIQAVHGSDRLMVRWAGMSPTSGNALTIAPAGRVVRNGVFRLPGDAGAIERIRVIFRFVGLAQVLTREWPLDDVDWSGFRECPTRVHLGIE
jgi:Trypsin-like peptidase domain